MVRIGSGKDLGLNREQTITWANDGEISPLLGYAWPLFISQSLNNKVRVFFSKFISYFLMLFTLDMIFVSEAGPM